MSNKQLSIVFGLFIFLTASNFNILANQANLDVQTLRELDFNQAPESSERTPASTTADVSKAKSPEFNDAPKAIGESLVFEFGCNLKSLVHAKGAKARRNVASTTLYGKALEDRARIQATHNLVLMKGKICLKGGMLLHRVKNFTNGFTASVFAKSNQSFQTDFIQLNNGVNEVIFEFKNAAGEKKQEKVFVQFDQI